MSKTPSETAGPCLAEQAESSAPEIPASDRDLGQFIRDNNNALTAYVYSWVRSQPDARDIVQEAYCRIFRMNDLQSVGHLRGYLFRTARNIATDCVRQRIVRESYVLEEPLRGGTEAPSPEEIWLAREELETVERAIEALPPKCKHALIMVRFDGASYEEVAQKLGIKTHSARRLVERAMEFLLEKKVPRATKIRRSLKASVDPNESTTLCRTPS